MLSLEGFEMNAGFALAAGTGLGICVLSEPLRLTGGTDSATVGLTDWTAITTGSEEEDPFRGRASSTDLPDGRIRDFRFSGITPSGAL